MHINDCVILHSLAKENNKEEERKNPDHLFEGISHQNIPCTYMREKKHEHGTNSD
jgi:hypothetical protein